MQQFVVVSQYATYCPHPVPQSSLAMHLHVQVSVFRTGHGSFGFPDVVPGGVRPPPKPVAVAVADGGFADEVAGGIAQIVGF